MDVDITNQGGRTIRVIIDGDTVDDVQLAPDETASYTTRDEGKLELRELGDGEPPAEVAQPKGASAHA
jgi:hypothetical protein